MDAQATRLFRFVIRFGFAGLVLLSSAIFAAGSSPTPPRLHTSFSRGPDANASAKTPPSTPSASLAANYGKLPMAFEINQGQTDRKVNFLARGQGYSLFLTPGEAVMSLQVSEAKPTSASTKFTHNKTAAAPSAARPVVHGAVVRTRFVGANPNATVSGIDELPGISNYFIGKDASKWRTHVHSYAKVVYAGIYPGVDLIYYGNQQQLEYDFVLAPGADPNTIQIDFDGVEQLTVDSDGNLVLDTATGKVTQRKPQVYQTANGKRQAIVGGYRVNGKRASFALASYDKTKPVTIDPVLVYSTYLGSSGYDRAGGVAVDSTGNAYLVGTTFSTDFPVMSGISQSPSEPTQLAFVSKLNSAGSALVYSTYFGGTTNYYGSNEIASGNAISIDDSGNAYITGATNADDFPITPLAYQSTPFTYPTTFVSKIGSDGASLVYSTYLTGTEGNCCYGAGTTESGNAIKVDSAGNAYVTGVTSTPSFVTTPGAYIGADERSSLFFGLPIGFVVKFNSAGSQVIYSTLLGGSTYDWPLGIDIDGNGNAYVVGHTGSSDYPVTTGAYQSTQGPSFAAKLNDSGSGLLYSTYLPGDYANGVAVDSAGNAYVAATDQVVKLNPSGSALVYSINVGGNAIAVDGDGNAYVVGDGAVPTTPDAFQTSAGTSDESAHLAVINTAGSAISYATRIGGSINRNANDFGSGIALDPNLGIYIVGSTHARDFPVTVGAVQPVLRSDDANAFIAKFQQSAPLIPAGIAFSPTHGAVGDSITITGSNFSLATGGNIVSLNGARAMQVTPIDSATLSVVVPAGATNGPITVTVAGQSATSASTFTVDVGLSISGFGPPSGSPGTAVMIIGSGFDSNAANDTVLFNGTAADIVLASPTSITAKVPQTATTGPIAVTVNGQTATTSTPFRVLSSSSGGGDGGGGGGNGGPIYPSADICSDTAPEVDPGTNAGFSGLWWNPQRYGTAWEFNFVPQGIEVTWVTYDALHRPVWLSNGGAVTTTQVDATGAKQYLVPLFWVTRLPGASTYNLTQAGQVAITFKAGSTVAAAVRWQWTAVSPAVQPDECVYDFFHQPGGAAPSSSRARGLAQAWAADTPSSDQIDESYTGAWYDPTAGQSGWGFFVSVGTDSNGLTREADTLFVFDTAGNPTWLQAANPDGPLLSEQDLSLNYAKSSASGYPNGYPINDCSDFSCLDIYSNVGTLTRAFTSSQIATVSATANVSAQTTGADAVAWPNDPIANDATLSKLSDTTVVLVNMTSCVVPSGANACNVVVSWTTTETNARLYRRNRITGDLSSALSGDASGSFSDPLLVGDWQYELYVSDPTTTLPIFISAEVLVFPANSAIPNPPTGVTVRAGASGTGIAMVAWDPDPATEPTVTYYELAYATSASGPWTVVNGALPRTLLNAAATVPASNTYYFGVAACNAAGCSAFTPSAALAITGVPSSVVTSINSPPPTGSVDDLPTHDPTVGTMAGQASTDGGAAQYHVPIVVPSGRAGMQPDIALTYNSRSGNGVMGMGWTISGLSSIHRCPQTPEQDGQALGVSYSNTDRLCLDGQRLVAVSGTYGQDGTQYRTEVDSYARITQVGGDLGSTDSACFRVEQKNGRILHYGGITTSSSCASSSVNSRVKPSGATAALSWLVEKIEDRVGNNQTYTYTTALDSAGAIVPGEVLISQIAYTGFTPTSAVGDRTVTFAYQTRAQAVSGTTPAPTDISSSYLAGGLTMQTQALQSITMAVAGSTVRTYTPSYTTSSYNRRLMMTSLTECATKGSSAPCHAPTQFSYNDSDLNFSFSGLQNVALPAGVLPSQTHSIGDLTGDGVPEVVIRASDHNHNAYGYLVQLNANGSVASSVDVGAGLEDGVMVDIDGDGRQKWISNISSATLSFAVWKGGRTELGSDLVKAQYGNTTTTQAQNFAALFANVPSNITWPISKTTTPPKAFAADMNGDGKPDVVIAVQDGASSCTNPGAGVSSVYGTNVYIYPNAISGHLNDGALAQFASAQGPFCFSVTSLILNGGVSVAIDHIADFDGDGIPDIFYHYVTNVPNGQQGDTLELFGVKKVNVSSTGVISLTDLGVYFSEKYTTPIGPATYSGTPSAVVRWLDVNGDGLEDLVFAVPPNTWYSVIPGGTLTSNAASQAQASNNTFASVTGWTVALNKGGSALTSPITVSNGNAGLQMATINFRYAAFAPVLDIDGDGKPDLLTPSITKGFALKTCSTIQVSTGGTSFYPAYACPEDPGSNSLNMPVDGSGNYYWTDETGQTRPVVPRYQGGLFGFDAGVDDTIYYMDSLKFIQTASDAFTLQVVDTPIVSRLNSSPNYSVNTTGIRNNGLTSVFTPIGCTADAVWTGVNNDFIAGCAIVGDGTHGPAALPDGTQASVFKPTPAPSSGALPGYTIIVYGNNNNGTVSNGPSAQSVANQFVTVGATATTSCPAGPALPGLLSSAVNGLGDKAQWGYDTLSLGFLCKRDGVMEYAITNPSTNDEQGYADGRHYYFGSSMPVVSAMLQSNGIGGNTGSRSAIYSYSEAMYNHLGRGFQGFHKITTETVTSEESRRLITTTTFRQKFPLVGKIDSAVTTTTPANGSVTIHSESSTYSCEQADGTTSTCPEGDTLPAPTGATVYQPVVVAKASSDFDLTNGQLSGHSNTTTSWDIYGNPLVQTVTHADDVASTRFVSGHTTTTHNTYDTSDTVNWWINKLTASSVQASIDYVAPPPNGTSVAPQTLTSQFTWNADRTLASKTVQPGVANQQSTTTYTYPTTSYGLPSQVQINAPDLAAALSPSRATSYTYTKDGTTTADDGYFVHTKTLDPTTSSHNGLNHTMAFTVQTNDGQITSATDPNGVVVATTYDAFGRAIEVEHKNAANAPIESPIQSAYVSCGSTCSGVGEDGSDGKAVYRVTTTQMGYPTKVAWVDSLGRTVKQAQAGFSGTGSTSLNYTFIATLTDYDEDGTVENQSTPYFVGGVPHLTTYDYDALNRVTSKAVQNACGGAMTTSYTYTGRETDISASGHCSDGSPANGPITMSRSYNVLGQLMQTVDANGNTTSYWTEPLGHVAAIRDVEQNITKASYNELGQRTQSIDPDQGTWNFSYSAFGELLSQTDARGVVTTVNSRDAIGRTTQQQQVWPASATGPSNENLLDSWTYDPVNGIDELASITRQRGTASPASNPQTWSESYTYDTSARQIATTTTISEGTSVPLTTNTVYDSFGRIATQTYPDTTGAALGLQVQRTYTAYGQLNALSNATSGYVYWSSQAENEWGHVAQEQYPGVITGNHADDVATGQTATLSWSGATSDEVDYHYDSFGNVYTQTRSAGPTVNTETYTYDVLQRLTSATRATGQQAVNYTYSASGNITNKSDNGSDDYTYPGANGHINNCGPHAVVSANRLSYGCDANGNIISGAITATYDTENHPRTITRDAGSMSWTYATTGTMTTEVAGSTTRYFGRNGYEQVGIGSTAKQIHELGPVIVTRSKGVDKVSVVLRDRLGSTINVLDANRPAARTYDAFGKVRLGDMSDSNGTLDLADTIHGFTKHDHADDVQLIHMGGRVYDYNLGRFLQVDPIIQNPAHSQSLNPYSYVGNNPLSGVDPTGYQDYSYAATQFAGFMQALGCSGGSSGNCAAVEANRAAESQGYEYTGHLSAYMAGVELEHDLGDLRRELSNPSAATKALEVKLAVQAITALIVRAKIKAADKANGSEKQQVADRRSKDASSTGQSSETDKNVHGPYSHLEDHSSVDSGKDFTRSQKQKILDANRERNGGVLKSDQSGEELVAAKKSEKGVTPPENEVQVDHHDPKANGGSNSFSNARVLSRKENNDKSDTPPSEIQNKKNCTTENHDC